MTSSATPKWATPATDDLIYALGRIVYNFTQLDHSAERMRRWAADRLGLDLPNLSWEQTIAELERVPVPEAAENLPSQVLLLCRRYIKLKVRRDRLLGITPHSTAQDAWSTDGILNTARDMEITAIEINRLLRRFF